MFLDGLKRFGRLIGVAAGDEEAALHSELAAKAVLTRRDFGVAASALASGLAFSFAPKPFSERAVVWAPSFVHLHTGEFSEGGEVSYSGYAPVPIDDWEIRDDGVATNRQPIVFPMCHGDMATLTHASIVDGSGRELWAGKLDAAIRVQACVSPLFAAGTLRIS